MRSACLAFRPAPCGSKRGTDIAAGVEGSHGGEQSLRTRLVPSRAPWWTDPAFTLALRDWDEPLIEDWGRSTSDTARGRSSARRLLALESFRRTPVDLWLRPDGNHFDQLGVLLVRQQLIDDPVAGARITWRTIGRLP